jgi:serine-type D-Ala-D-Ala carboxypeptidase (penicillin-binding protein 5/6)
VHAGERERHDRVAEHPDAYGTGEQLPLAAGNHQASWRAPERDDPLAATALPTRPEEEAGGPDLEPAEGADLHLELALAAAHPGLALAPFDATHLDFDSIRWPTVRLLVVLFLLAAFLAWPAATSAQEPPPVKAKAVVVADGTGEVLYSYNGDQRRAIASITKIMTALVTLARTKPGVKVTVQGPAPDVGESTFGLQVGEELRVRDLLTAALVQSANDAAYALATYIGHGKVKRFVRLMNKRASALGLDDTHYVRPDGLDAQGGYSTADDVLAIAREAMKQGVFRKIVKMKGGIVAGRSLYVWNDLLSTYPGAIGVKTGHTDRAGWSEVAAAKRDGLVLYAVLLGAPSRERRNKDLTKLLNWGFGQYGLVRVIESGRTYATAEIPFSDERVPLLAGRAAFAQVRLGRPLVERVIAPAEIDPPVGFGESVGEVRIYDGDRIVARRTLVASRTVVEPGLTKKVGWYAGEALNEAGDMLSSLSPF